MQLTDRSFILKKYSLFTDLTDEEYLQLDVSDNYKEAKKGEYIYFEAYQHQNIYFIKTGKIRLGYLDKDGNKIIKDVLGPGDFFGQVSLRKENLNGELPRQSNRMSAYVPSRSIVSTNCSPVNPNWQ